MDERLVGYLREQIRFIQASAASYDAGFQGEARRLATTLRVLVHDTGNSHSLLSQMDLKDRMRWTDTSIRAQHGRTVSHGGLCLVQAHATGWQYVPVLDRFSPHRINQPVVFDVWWEQAIASGEDGSSLSRRRFVQTTANRTGGAHVDPKLDKAYEKLVETALFADTVFSPNDEMGDLALANVRQIAWETEQTVNREIRHLLDPRSLGRDKPLPELLAREAERNDPCPCGSGRKFKRCHGW